MFNEHFGSIFQQSNVDLFDIFIPDSPDSSDWCPLLTPMNVERALSSLTSKGTGSDNIPPLLLKAAAHHLSAPLCHLYNTSIILKAVPDQWKIAKIIPIPKCKSPQLKDHRPISLLPVVSKVLERFLLDHLSDPIVNNFGKNQFGFRKNSSTTCALISVVDAITRKWEESSVKAISVISYDASKAFDTVPHDILLNRLVELNLPSGFIAWYRSYLTNRQQFVSLNGSNSSYIPVLSGVPQGAILSPSMFCLYISSLSAYSDFNDLFKYADDMLLTIYHTSSENDELMTDAELRNITNWCEQHRIKLNQEKTSRMVMKKSTSASAPDYECLRQFQETDSLKILGATVTSNLCWSAFIKSAIKKGSRCLYTIRMLKTFLNKEDLLMLYTLLVQSHLDYCSPLYVGSISSADKAEVRKFVSRCHRIICGPQCMQECIPDIDSRRMSLATNLFNAALNNPSHVLHELLPPFLPSGRRLAIPPHISCRRANSFIIYMSLCYNR